MARNSRECLIWGIVGLLGFIGLIRCMGAGERIAEEKSENEDEPEVEIFSGSCADLRADSMARADSIKGLGEMNAPTLSGEKLDRIIGVIMGTLEDAAGQWPRELLEKAIHRSNGYHPEMMVKERMAQLLGRAEFTAEEVADGVKRYLFRDYALAYRAIEDVDYSAAPASYIDLLRKIYHYDLIPRTDHEKKTRAIQEYLAHKNPRAAAQAIFDLFPLAADNPYADLPPDEYLTRLEHARQQSKDFYSEMEKDIGEKKSWRLYRAIIDFWKKKPHTSGSLFLGYASKELLNLRGVHPYLPDVSREMARIAEGSGDSADFIALLKERAQYTIPAGENLTGPDAYKANSMHKLVYEIYQLGKKSDFKDSDINALVDAYYDRLVILAEIEKKEEDLRFASNRQTKEAYAAYQAFYECRLLGLSEGRETWHRFFGSRNTDAVQKRELALAYWLKRAYAALGCYTVPGVDLPEYYRRVQREYPKLLNDLVAKKMNKEESMKAVLTYWESNPIAASCWVPDPDL